MIYLNVLSIIIKVNFFILQNRAKEQLATFLCFLTIPFLIASLLSCTQIREDVDRTLLPVTARKVEASSVTPITKGSRLTMPTIMLTSSAFSSPRPSMPIRPTITATSNRLPHTDSTEHFSDDVIAAAYGVDKVENIWWWNDPAYTGWQQIFRQAGFAYILVAEVRGSTYEIMFVEGQYDNEIVLWNINHATTVDPDFVKGPSKWQLFRSETKDYRNFRRHLLGKQGYMLVEPVLQDRWYWNHKNNNLVHAEYAYPSWSKTEYAVVSAAAAGGAIGGCWIGPATGGTSILIGGAAAGTAAAVGVEISRRQHATMRPRFHPFEYNRNYYSTASHHPFSCFPNCQPTNLN